MPHFFEDLTQKTKQLVAALLQQARDAQIPLSANQVGGMFGLFFTEQEPVTNFSQVMQCDIERFKRFFHGMLQGGVYLAPSPYEAGFVSMAHSTDDFEQTVKIAEEVFASL